ncbi:hypothetical protein B0F90DRAFT_1666683 [Multifurca ochricompacta]|uniref:Uncharacterized protein n=1 Tax=Multifurca ochricompacta TaxID=376703 RepID=A0AAD4M7W2_9AGAM|nr:hypothetical protein B0F90DRAFT_1666683 [Multifurca ochricompacta]
MLPKPKTDDSVWSFNLRSYNPCDFSDSDSDGSHALADNPCSDGSTLVDQPLSEDNDTAVFKPNPWSIAKINAASRLAQKSQESISINETSLCKVNKRCDKKQPQGRIVDLFKKQAEQPPLAKASGLRPSDAPSRSSGTRRRKDCSKKPAILDSVAIIPESKNSPGNFGYPTKAVYGTRHSFDAISATNGAPHIGPALPSSSHVGGSAAPRSGLLFQSAQVSSTQASVGQFLGPSASARIPHPRTAVFPQHLKPSASSLTHRKQRIAVSSVVREPIIARDDFLTNNDEPPPAPTIMCAHDPLDIAATHVHRISEIQNGPPTGIPQDARTHLKSPSGTRLIGPSVPTSPHAAHHGRSTRADTKLDLPQRAYYQPYDHPALQPPVDEDAEWSTLQERKPRPCAQSKNTITTSGSAAGVGERPRVILYLPPPRVVAVDIPDIKRRYASVRGAMRKRRCASAAAWDALGLPSCGAVYVDGSAAAEVGILVWRGEASESG